MKRTAKAREWLMEDHESVILPPSTTTWGSATSSFHLDGRRTRKTVRVREVLPRKSTARRGRKARSA